MNLTLLDKTYSFDRNQLGIQALIEKINSELSTESRFFSHLVIDGVEVFEDHEEYILAHIDNVKDIKVVVQTIEEFIGNLLVSLNTYTQRAIPEIERLINEFYQNPTEQSWLTLHQLLDGINWIYETIKGIDNAQQEINGWDEFIKIVATFEVELPNLLEALENKDSILIADIIQYEILPQFQVIHKGTEKLFQQQNSAK
ncbi:hypothetical protein KDN24_14680 [Bacillus sp. Bva_UNVM-123]|uniref:hypothetical protein n=1 Tax=Bacillus sp. Bva_UNVM-123 TaxID=2829798 RepID=UPI00391F589D